MTYVLINKFDHKFSGMRLRLTVIRHKFCIMTVFQAWQVTSYIFSIKLNLGKDHAIADKETWKLLVISA